MDDKKLGLICFLRDEEGRFADEACEDCGYVVDYAGLRLCDRCCHLRKLENGIREAPHSDWCSTQCSETWDCDCPTRDLLSLLGPKEI